MAPPDSGGGGHDPCSAVTFPGRPKRSVGTCGDRCTRSARPADHDSRGPSPPRGVTCHGTGSRRRLLALIIADVPFAGLARQSLNSSGGSAPVWFSAAFGAVGFVVAWRKPRNPLGWLLLGGAVFLALSQDASFYTVADYRLRRGDLPLGWVAVLAQPGWALGIVFVGLAILLFPDGRPPSSRWRSVLWVDRKST